MDDMDKIQYRKKTMATPMLLCTILLKLPLSLYQKLAVLCA